MPESESEDFGTGVRRMHQAPSPPYKYVFYELGDEEYVLDVSGDDPLPTLYRRAGETENLRTMAVHDGSVFLHEDVLEIVYEDGGFVAYHGWTGREFFATLESNFSLGTAVLLEEVENRV